MIDLRETPHRVMVDIEEAHGSSYVVLNCSTCRWHIEGVALDWDELAEQVEAHRQTAQWDGES